MSSPTQTFDDVERGVVVSTDAFGSASLFGLDAGHEFLVGLLMADIDGGPDLRMHPRCGSG